MSFARRERAGAESSWTPLAELAAPAVPRTPWRTRDCREVSCAWRVVVCDQRHALGGCRDLASPKHASPAC